MDTVAIFSAFFGALGLAGAIGHLILKLTLKPLTDEIRQLRADVQALQVVRELVVRVDRVEEEVDRLREWRHEWHNEMTVRKLRETGGK